MALEQEIELCFTFSPTDSGSLPSLPWKLLLPQGRCSGSTCGKSTTQSRPVAAQPARSAQAAFTSSDVDGDGTKPKKMEGKMARSTGAVSANTDMVCTCSANFEHKFCSMARSQLLIEFASLA